MSLQGSWKTNMMLTVRPVSFRVNRPEWARNGRLPFYPSDFDRDSQSSATRNTNKTNAVVDIHTHTHTPRGLTHLKLNLRVIIMTQSYELGVCKRKLTIVQYIIYLPLSICRAFRTGGLRNRGSFIIRIYAHTRARARALLSTVVHTHYTLLHAYIIAYIAYARRPITRSVRRPPDPKGHCNQRPLVLFLYIFFCYSSVAACTVV